jgi:putative exosortase-associated protein (TIGR04073 family)
MRNTISFLFAVVVTGLLASGCAGPEKKLGRGMSNTGEVFRWGELRRTMEQTALFSSPNEAYTAGVIKGFNRSMSRIGLGLYEMVTSPIPSYDPICTSYLSPNPVYPDNYKPSLVALPAFDTTTELGFTGGSVLPIVPNNRFHIFDE